MTPSHPLPAINHPDGLEPMGEGDEFSGVKRLVPPVDDAEDRGEAVPYSESSELEIQMLQSVLWLLPKIQPHC
jgi:hypothetical protein